tara:strand:+ start:68 stop:412 length:345 start_codon:yes stop_codon:yes gene_type:complete
MKISRRQLKRIIREAVLNEYGAGHGPRSHPSEEGRGSDRDLPRPTSNKASGGWYDFIEMVRDGDYDSAGAWLQGMASEQGAQLMPEDEEIFFGLADEGPQELQAEWIALTSGPY